MVTQLEGVKHYLMRTAHRPGWLSTLLDTVPGLPADALPHNKPCHPDLQSLIADGSFHPAIEAALHLMNVSTNLSSLQSFVVTAARLTREVLWAI